MAKLFDKLMNRVIKGKLIVEQGDELGDEVVKVETSSKISELSDELIDSLKVGDVVQKVTGNMKHCYIVTYKEEHKGICLSYFDCGYLETISYDYTAGHWVFNSKDVCEVQEKITSSTDLVVKTLKQTEANYKVNILPYLIPTSSDLVVADTSFAELNWINGCIHIVGCFSVSNTGESSVQLNFGNAVIPIPHEVATHIYAVNGRNLGETGQANAFIRAFYIMASNISGFVARLRTTANADEIEFNSGNLGGIGVGEARAYSFEVTLTVV